MSYAFRVRPPTANTSVAISGSDREGPVISAMLSGTRMELTDATLLKALFSHPLLTLKVTAAIHWQALKMVLKGFRLYPHGQKTHFSVTVIGRNGMPP
jgi:uncharacterized protein